MARRRCRYRIVALGVSTGGVEALQILVGGLPGAFPVPILVAHHVSPDPASELAALIGRRCALHVKEADEEESLVPGTLYLAPANYHLLVETDGSLALSVDPPVNYARPSVDVLFESVASVFGPAAIGVILTGAGEDGSRGLKAIKERGGTAIVQDPADAAMDGMPLSALDLVAADHIVRLAEVAALLCRLTETAPRNWEATA